jgi:hypothetical protein
MKVKLEREEIDQKVKQKTCSYGRALKHEPKKRTNG